MTGISKPVPDHTAVRVALWRALHLQLDPPPHVFVDEVGLKMAEPPADWTKRPDMDPMRTRTMRSSIVARARVVEETVAEQAAKGVTQYVIMGAGLDSFAQRRPKGTERVTVFEIDQPQTQAWKRRRLEALGLGVPASLRFVPVDFEKGQNWWEELVKVGFDPKRPAVVASTGVAMYLSRETNAATLKQFAKLAPGSTFVMSFLRPVEQIDPEERRGMEAAMKGAAAAGTPFLSFFSPDDILAFARDAGFKDARHVSAVELNRRYFAGRSDGLRTSSGEEILVATT